MGESNATLPFESVHLCADTQTVKMLQRQLKLVQIVTKEKPSGQIRRVVLIANLSRHYALVTPTAVTLLGKTYKEALSALWRRVSFERELEVRRQRYHIVLEQGAFFVTHAETGATVSPKIRGLVLRTCIRKWTKEG